MKKVLSSILFFFLVLLSNAQDFTFSQFYEMPLLRNPALSGIYTGSIRIQSAYRNQWASVTVPFQTNALSAELKKPIGSSDDLITFGVQVSTDKAGDSKLGRIQVEPVINFLKSINDDYSYISLALMGGYTESKFDPTLLTFDDQFVGGQFNPLNATQQVFTKTSMSYADGGAGLAFSSALPENEMNYYFGIGGFHLLKPKVNFFNDKSIILKPRYVINGGLHIPTNEFDNVYFYGDYILQGGARQFLSGVIFSHLLSDYEYSEYFGKSYLHFGAAYRWADALIPIVKLELKKYFIGASYDINISKLKSASMYRGGFEMTFSFKSFFNVKNFLECPPNVLPKKSLETFLGF